MAFFELGFTALPDFALDLLSGGVLVLGVFFATTFLGLLDCRLGALDLPELDFALAMLDLALDFWAAALWVLTRTLTSD